MGHVVIILALVAVRVICLQYFVFRKFFSFMCFLWMQFISSWRLVNCVLVACVCVIVWLEAVMRRVFGSAWWWWQRE